MSEDVGNSRPVGGQVYSLYGMILAKVKRRFLLKFCYPTSMCVWDGVEGGVGEVPL